MPTRLLVALEPVGLHPAGPPPSTGRALREIVRQRLNLAAEGAALGDVLHDRRDVQPFAISPLVPPNAVADAWHFYVGMLDDAPVESLGEDLATLFCRGIAAKPEMQVGRSRFTTAMVGDRHHPYGELVSTSVARHRWPVVFHTPTTVRTAGPSQVDRSQPWPAPALIFGSLLRRWRRFSDVPLTVGVEQAVENLVSVERHRIHTERHEVGRTGKGETYHRVGFVGQVEFACAVGGGAHPTTPPDILRGLTALLRFGELTGVGDHTPIGMGVMTPEGVDL